MSQKVDRQKEIEKIADKLGIGLNSKVKCISCKKTIKRKNTVIIVNGQERKDLCKTCYKDLLSGKFKDNTQVNINKNIIKKLKELDKIEKSPLSPSTIPHKTFPNPKDLPTPEKQPWEKRWNKFYYGDMDISYINQTRQENILKNIFKAEYVNRPPQSKQ